MTHTPLSWKLKNSGCLRDEIEHAERLEAVNAELLELLKWHADVRTGIPDLDGSKARALIAKIQEQMT